MALESAKAKLEGKFVFDDLPADRSDALWDKIEAEYKLTLPEVSALKNKRCKSPGTFGGNPFAYDPTSDADKYWKLLENVKLKSRSGLDYLKLELHYNVSNKLEQLRREGEDTSELVVRKCYDDLSTQILEAARIKRVVYVTGTPGVGKTTFRNFMAWKILQSFKGKSVAVVMLKGGAAAMDVYQSDGSKSEVESWNSVDAMVKHKESQGFVLGTNFFLLADVSRGDIAGLTDILRALIIFSSPNGKVWKEGEKQEASRFFMPLWKEEEILMVQKDKKHRKVLYDRFVKYDGVIRYVWGSKDDIQFHEERLRKDISDETLAALNSSDWERVEHKFVHLVVTEKKDGGYNFTSLPELRMASRYIARLAAQGVIRRRISLVRRQFYTTPPAVFGMLFEAVCMELLLHYCEDTPFFMLRISHMKTLIHKQLRAMLTPKSPGYVLKLREPTFVEFNSEVDVMSAVHNGIKKYASILALPRSTQFAGFDAIYATQEGSKKSALLIQATTSSYHPLSQIGGELLTEFANLFDEVDIVYFVECGQQDGFSAQKLATHPSAELATLFAKTHQWCLSASVGGPLPKSLLMKEAITEDEAKVAPKKKTKKSSEDDDESEDEKKKKVVKTKKKTKKSSEDDDEPKDKKPKKSKTSPHA